MKKLYSKYRLLLLLGLILSNVNYAVAANIIASLNRNPVMLDESFTLQLQSDASVSDPDLLVLEKDFDILNRSQSTNMSYMNGAFSKKSTWTISLLAKKIGTFKIPSITFGKDSSPALRVTVIPASQSPDTKDHEKEIFLESEIKTKTHWVQSQLIYTVRLFSRVALNNLRGSELSTSDPDAIIEQLGEATTYEAIRGGLRYAVREMRFAIYPQHSGGLTINPMVFEGRVSQNRPQSIFDQFINSGELRRMRSERQQLTIKPIPESIKPGEWLPASKIRLSDHWSEDVNQLKVGEPVTRTIKITANGPMAKQLPELILPEATGFKQYPNKPVNESHASKDGVNSTQEIKVALIPTQAGKFTIPATSLPWWNTNTGREEIAHLPEVMLNVTGVAASTQATTSPTVISTEIQPAEKTVQLEPSSIAGMKHQYWPWISLFLATGWLLTLIVMFVRRQPGAEGIKPNKPASIKPLEKAVQKYCRAGDTQLTKNALIDWAKARRPGFPITSLADVATLTDKELSTEIGSLNATLYSQTPEKWDGNPLLNAFKIKQQIKQPVTQIKENALEPLYKG